MGVYARCVLPVGPTVQGLGLRDTSACLGHTSLLDAPPHSGSHFVPISQRLSFRSHFVATAAESVCFMVYICVHIAPRQPRRFSHEPPRHSNHPRGRLSCNAVRCMQSSCVRFSTINGCSTHSPLNLPPRPIISTLSCLSICIALRQLECVSPATDPAPPDPS